LINMFNQPGNPLCDAVFQKCCLALSRHNLSYPVISRINFFYTDVFYISAEIITK